MDLLEETWVIIYSLQVNVKLMENETNVPAENVENEEVVEETTETTEEVAA